MSKCCYQWQWQLKLLDHGEDNNANVLTVSFGLLLRDPVCVNRHNYVTGAVIVSVDVQSQHVFITTNRLTIEQQEKNSIGDL